MVETHYDTVVAEVLRLPFVGHRDGGQGVGALRGVLLCLQGLDRGDEVVGPVEVRAEVRAVRAVSLPSNQRDSDLEVGHVLVELVLPGGAERLLELGVVDGRVEAPTDVFGELHESSGQRELALVPAQALSLQFNTDALRRVEVAEHPPLVLLLLEQPNEAEVSVLRLVDGLDDERVARHFDEGRGGATVATSAVHHDGEDEQGGDNQGCDQPHGSLLHGFPPGVVWGA